MFGLTFSREFQGVEDRDRLISSKLALLYRRKEFDGAEIGG